MQFVKSGDIYKVARITGTQDNLLGVTLCEHQGEVELVALESRGGAKVSAEPEEVLRQVTAGLADVNRELGTNYCLSKIFYLPGESATNLVYTLLIVALVRKIEAGEIAEAS